MSKRSKQPEWAGMKGVKGLKEELISVFSDPASMSMSTTGGRQG
jgi:hypothetical protein